MTGPFRTTNRVLSDLPDYEYHATHPAVTMDGSGCYWLSITNDLSPGCAWMWGTARPGDGRSAQDGRTSAGADGFGASDTIGEDLAFCLGIPLATAGSCASPPGHDACENAIPISDGQATIDLAGATTDGPPSGRDCKPGDECCFLAIGERQISRDVWFTYRATCTGVLEAEVGGSGYPLALSVYRGAACPTNPNAATCAQSGIAEEGSATGLSLRVAEGEELKLRVGIAGDPKVPEFCLYRLVHPRFPGRRIRQGHPGLS